MATPTRAAAGVHGIRTLKASLDRHARATGVTRAHLVQEALSHHLQALAELPPEAIVPKRIVLTRESAERVRDLVERPPSPRRT